MNTNENYIMINGKRTYLTDEQLEQLGIKKDIYNPYTDSNYRPHTELLPDSVAYDAQNHPLIHFSNTITYSLPTMNDKDYAQAQIWREALNRELQRFSYENDGGRIDTSKQYWIIFYDDRTQKWITMPYARCVPINTPLFVSETIAKRAIREVIDPFIKEHCHRCFKVWG